MTDAIFDGLLNQNAIVLKPQAQERQDLGLDTPLWETAGQLRVRVCPSGEDSRETALGLLQATDAVGYCEPADISAGCRLGIIAGNTKLLESAGAGAAEISVEADDIEAGVTLVVGGGRGEACLVLALTAEQALLSQPLRYSWETGTSVLVVRCYEVLGVEDEAGAGHHLRLGLRKVQV